MYIKNKVVCFHNPNEQNGYLSNWYLSNFRIKGITYTSMEQYMMHQKALVFGDDKSACEILKTSDVAKVKALGRGVSGYDDAIWNGLRQLIVYEGLYEKFSQNAELKQQLIMTGDCILAECAVQDKVWGIGVGMKNVDRLDIRKWKGQNLLGFALMKVRDEIA